MSSSSLGMSGGTVAVGIDLGSLNARVATYDIALDHPVLVHNRDGHRTTKVERVDAEGPSANTVTAETLKEFYQDHLLQLASDSAHTQDLLVVTSVPNDMDMEDDENNAWLKLLQEFGGVITEAAAVCLAYDVEVENTNNPQQQRVLVLDGGASGLKATLLSSCNTASSCLWKVDSFQKLGSVNGTILIESLAQSVAQQFEQKHRFPRGEVWESKKARRKLQAACESGLKTLHINNSTVTIHVDGLYEGMDCQVPISKPKWQHLQSKLANETKAFLKPFVEHNVDAVFLSGNLHTWLKPIVQSVFTDNQLVCNNAIDPSEAIALGCTKQAYFNLQQQEQPESAPPTMKVPISPVSIGIKNEADNTILIDRGTPLPAIASHVFVGKSLIHICQFEPTEKQLATLEEEESCTLRLQLSPQGKLWIWVNGELLEIG